MYTIFQVRENCVVDLITDFEMMFSDMDHKTMTIAKALASHDNIIFYRTEESFFDRYCFCLECQTYLQMTEGSCNHLLLPVLCLRIHAC